MSDNAAPPNVQANDAARLNPLGGKPVLFVSVERHLGGAEKSLLTVLTAVPPPPLRPVLLCRPGAAIGTVCREAGVEVCETGMIQRHLARQPLAYGLSLLRVLSLRLRPATVLADGWRAVPYACLLSKIQRCPLVVHLRECDLPPSHITRRMAASADLITTVSFAQQAFFRKQPDFLSRKKNTPLATVHNGLDPTTYLREGPPPAELRARFGLKPDDLGVVLPGYLLPNKGGDDFLDTARLLIPQHPNLHFYFLGGPFPETGSHEDAAFPEHLSRRITSEGLTEKIHLLGHRDDVPDVLWAMDIAVVPTRDQEAFGRVAAEAMFAGKPVIASRLGGLVEIVEDGSSGLLTPPRDATALARAIEQLALDPALRHRLGAHGQERALTHFTAEQKAGGMWQLIQGLIP